jgi:acyl dehydratase
MALTGRYIDKYERRGKGYVVFEAEARDAATGEMLVRQISTEIMRIPEGVQLGSASAPPPERRVSGVWPAQAQPLVRGDPDISVGRPVQPLTKTAHQDQMSVFSGADNQWTNIHTDVRIAKAAGFRDTLAQGAMESCWTSEMLANAFGPAWFSTGWISHVYLKPVFRGDTITCRGVITGLEMRPEGRQVELEVWAENQSGVMTAAGWARAIV